MEDNNSFFKYSFFRSSNGTDYCWIFILWKINHVSKEPHIGFFHINSWLKFNPSHFFNKENFFLLKEKLLNRENYLSNNIRFIFDDKSLYVWIISKSNEYEFIFNEKEIFLLQNQLNYLENYLKNFEQINITNDILNKIPILNKGELLYFNKINNKFWKEKDIYIPFIEESFYVYKNNEKCSYYFKFFPEYLETIKNNDKDHINNISWFKYPFQVITQSNWKSEIITLSELEFLLLEKFLNDEKYFLEENILNKELFNDWIINKQSKYFIELENNYLWKKYINRDIINKETFEKLNSSIYNWDYNNVYIILNNLKEKWHLVNNRFINKEIIKSLNINKEEFINFKISRSDKGNINHESWILQFSKKVWSEDFTINMVKWDLSTNWIKFSTAPINWSKLCSFKYKTKIIKDLLVDQLKINKERILVNLSNYKYSKDNLDLILIEKDFYKLFKNKINFNDKIIFWNNNFNWTINIYYPWITKWLNSSIFKLKENIDNLDSERYFCSIYLKNCNGNKITNFKLNIWEFISLKDSFENNKAFELIWKNNNLYKKLKIVKGEGNILNILYWTSNKIDWFSKDSIRFLEKVDFNDFNIQLEQLISVVCNFDFLLNTALLKEKASIFLKNEKLKIDNSRFSL